MKNIITFCFAILAISQINAQTVLEIDSHQAHELLQTFDHQTGVLIDGRDSTMFASGHIDKAIKINAYKENLAENLTPYLTREKIMVYCTTHRRTTTIINMLKELDYKGEIIAVMDGINGWKENKLPMKQ